MPQVISCPKCAMRMQVPDDATGKQVRCPGCQNLFVIGAPAPAAAPQLVGAAAGGVASGSVPRPAAPPPPKPAAPPLAPPPPAAAKGPPTNCPACGPDLLPGA